MRYFRTLIYARCSGAQHKLKLSVQVVPILGTGVAEPAQTAFDDSVDRERVRRVREMAWGA